jgi:hypothetical protein
VPAPAGRAEGFQVESWMTLLQNGLGSGASSLEAMDTRVPTCPGYGPITRSLTLALVYKQHGAVAD